MFQSHLLTLQEENSLFPNVLLTLQHFLIQEMGLALLYFKS